MVEVAVYNREQHEQFICAASRFTLRRSAAMPARWLLHAEDQTQRAGEDCESGAAASGNIETGGAAHAFENDSPLAESLDFRLTEAGFMVVGESVHSADGRQVCTTEILPLPCVLRVGSTWLEVAATSEPPPLVPLKNVDLADFLGPQPATKEHAGPSSATVAKWLTQAGQLHRAAACSAQFYADAANFAVDAVGLDGAFVLKRNRDSDQPPWQIVGGCLRDPQYGVRYDSSVLDYLERDPVAWYQPTPDSREPSRPPRAVVIAPVLDGRGELTAAIYGIRAIHGENRLSENRREGIRPLEARLVQLLADSVSVGIARLDQETEAASARVLLEHAFSPTVAEYIQQHPESLSGQHRVVTLAFADLRGYTMLAETLEPAACYELLSDVMELLTQVVIDHRGVVVDYYGDGLLALWNAPLEQPNHADLACLAGSEMIDVLPAVSEKWQHRLGGPLELGVGIHSGPAQVGNAGTRSRLKYGPRGNTVNVASRVQAASKQLALPLVITAATRTELSSKFFALRACTAKLPGLERPTELFTVYPAVEAAVVKDRLDQYARALQLFEAGHLQEAETLLKQLVKLGQATPAHFLARYTAAQLNGKRGRRAVDKLAIQQGGMIEIVAK